MATNGLMIVPISITLQARFNELYASAYAESIPEAGLFAIDSNTGKRITIAGPHRRMADLLATRSPADAHSSVLYKKVTASGLVLRHGVFRLTPESKILSELNLDDITVRKT